MNFLYIWKPLFFFFLLYFSSVSSSPVISLFSGGWFSLLKTTWGPIPTRWFRQLMIPSQAKYVCSHMSFVLARALCTMLMELALVYFTWICSNCLFFCFLNSTLVSSDMSFYPFRLVIRSFSYLVGIFISSLGRGGHSKRGKRGPVSPTDCQIAPRKNTSWSRAASGNLNLCISSFKSLECLQNQRISSRVASSNCNLIPKSRKSRLY